MEAAGCWANRRRKSIKDKAKISLRNYDVGDKFSHLPLTKASVLMPLMVKDEKLHVLFTVRSMKVNVFSCFQMGSLITPVAGFIDDSFQACPNPEEVSAVFVVPLDYFINPVKYTALPYRASDGVSHWMHSFVYDDPEHNTSYEIWGLTAHFAVFLALVIFGERPTFDVEYDLDNLISSSEDSLLALYKTQHEKRKSRL
ncbi:PREDICTED: peroxisomal coenzyme A diphosphatase NUDT7 isoform X3 [Crocodylus porosus]|uniref:peroxisomal coenzyme A diphosphatase NUDT7 isoform X3 n=1 Tax=Crocodylus porosus TaxID=8502 RepID=UPI00094032AA|nr:PREDICTED: peroxisomal coenzyme A diphosphatase NUDT7 isoform X3 [Crocodylus porosus]